MKKFICTSLVALFALTCLASGAVAAGKKDPLAAQIAKAKEAGAEFISLPADAKAELIKKAASVYEKWGQKIGAADPVKVRATLGN